MRRSHRRPRRQRHHRHRGRRHRRRPGQRTRRHGRRHVRSTRRRRQGHHRRRPRQPFDPSPAPRRRRCPHRRLRHPRSRRSLRRSSTKPPAGRGADVVLECTGVPSAVAEGFELARRNGKYLVLGQYTDRGPTPINPHVITRKQLKVYGSWAFAEAHYPATSKPSRASPPASTWSGSSPLTPTGSEPGAGRHGRGQSDEGRLAGGGCGVSCRGDLVRVAPQGHWCRAGPPCPPGLRRTSVPSGAGVNEEGRGGPLSPNTEGGTSSTGPWPTQTAYRFQTPKPARP